MCHPKLLCAFAAKGLSQVVDSVHVLTTLRPALQIVNESFVEDISNLLNTYEVPNLMQNADLVTIFENIRPKAKSAGMVSTTCTQQEVSNVKLPCAAVSSMLSHCAIPSSHASHSFQLVLHSMLLCSSLDK